MTNPKTVLAIRRVYAENAGLKNRDDLIQIIYLYKSGNKNAFFDAVNELGKMDLVNLIKLWMQETGEETHVILFPITQALTYALTFFKTNNDE